MKLSLNIGLLFLCFFSYSFTVGSDENLNEMRVSFFSVAGDLKAAQKVYDSGLKNQKESIVYKAYLGTLQAMLAGNQSNPISKLSWFNKGKAIIEKAIETDSNNPEIRFLRLSIQLKAPGFLFYYSEIDSDKKNVIDNIKYFETIGIAKEVKLFLIENGNLTIEEVNKLKK